MLRATQCQAIYACCAQCFQIVRIGSVGGCRSGHGGRSKNFNYWIGGRRSEQSGATLP